MSLTPAGCESSPSACSSSEGACFGLFQRAGSLCTQRRCRAGSALPGSAPEFSELLQAPAPLLCLAEVAGMGWALLVPVQRGEEVTAGPCGML